MMIDKQELLDILTSEIESSTGCTDPGSVCLAVAVAAHTLGRRPEKIDVLVSPNIYKNGVSVGIPGTNRIGLELAAALGAGLDIQGPNGHMVVDVGAGTTDIAVLSLNGIVCKKSIKLAGRKLDEAIVRCVRTDRNVLIGEKMAERIKIEVGSIFYTEDKEMEAKGRNLHTGLPEKFVIRTSDIYDALMEQVMQIVQELAGYTMGQADNIRRAMSKKKQYVIDAERQNFVYGNEEQGIKGCIANGISEQAANKIYDSMVDFAKYAFNKSHAAAYAVVSYQTAYFKYYYPVEFMAALMTSVIDNTRKVSEYIFTCRQMGIKVLPPDVNEGEGVFTAVGDNIRYGLYAIKSIGRPVVDLILQEREENGTYKTLQSFLERVSCREVNKRAVENLIKAGALDGLDGNRQQMITVFSTIMDNLASEKKKSMSGQMTLFDLVPEEEKQDYEIRLPQLEEYSKEIKLGFEKEVLGIYLTGHPLEEYEERWRKNISAVTTDFVLDEETNEVKVKDNQKVTVGGMITEKTVKYTKNNKVMAFLTLEDLVGTVEVIVFPNSYEKYSSLLNEDEKVFITGRANVEEDKNGKIICEQITSFDSVKRELWLQFSTKEEFEAKEQELYGKLHDSDGRDSVVIYISSIKAMKRLPNNYNICINQEIVNNLTNFLGENNVKVVEKSIEKRA